MILGAHCSTSGGIWTAVERAQKIGAESCQLFVKNNMQWEGRAFRDAEIERYRQRRSELGISSVFGHTGYLINLGAPPSANWDRSVESLMAEIRLAEQLGLPFLVLHPGAHLGAGEDLGIKRVVQGLDAALVGTSGCRVKLALENTAGQGSCLGHRLEHLGEIFQRAGYPERLDICLDTAHLFAAGYDIRLPRVWDEVMGCVDRLVGLREVVAFHLNDSKTDLASRVDRHAGIGQGKLGVSAFRHILNDARFVRHPGCLETPKSEDLHEDVENLSVLRSLMLSGGQPRGHARKKTAIRRASPRPR